MFPPSWEFKWAFMSGEDSKRKLLLLLLLVVRMSGCRQESVCYTSTDRLTSGSLRLLIDTKETGAHAHSLSHTLLSSHAGKWTLSISVLDDQCSFHKQVEAEKECFFFLLLCCADTAGVCAATLNALFSDTKDVQQSLWLSPLFSLCLSLSHV